MKRLFQLWQVLAVLHIASIAVVKSDVNDDPNLDELIKEIFDIPSDQISGTIQPVTEPPHPITPITSQQPEHHPITQSPVETHGSYQPAETPNTNANINPDSNTNNGEHEANVSVITIVFTILIQQNLLKKKSQLFLSHA